jgi:hypothetical protein
MAWQGGIGAAAFAGIFAFFVHGLCIFLNTAFAVSGGVLTDKYPGANGVTRMVCGTNETVTSLNPRTTTVTDIMCDVDCTMEYSYVRAIFWLAIVTIILNVLSLMRTCSIDSKLRLTLFTFLIGAFSFLALFIYGIYIQVNVPTLCRSYYNSLWDFSLATFWLSTVAIGFVVLAIVIEFCEHINCNWN